MKPVLAAAVLALAGFGAATGQPAPQAPLVEIKGAVARVVVSPQSGAALDAHVTAANPRLPLKVRREGAKLVIDGGLKRERIRGCDAGPRGVARVRVSEIGPVDWAQIPQVAITAPPGVKLSASGAVFGSIGRARSVDLANDGCGDWTVADVEDRLRISQAGAGASRAGKAGSAQLRLAGSGGVSMGDVAGEVDIEMAGAGAVHAASVHGPLKVKIAGSGGARIDGGQASAMTATVAGAGGVAFGGVAQTLKASIAGSGDIRAAHVLGRVEKQIIGSGKVYAGR